MIELDYSIILNNIITLKLHESVNTLISLQEDSIYTRTSTFYSPLLLIPVTNAIATNCKYKYKS